MLDSIFIMQCLNHDSSKFWVKKAWTLLHGMDLYKANGCVVVGCDSWEGEEGDGMAWRPLAEWPWTSETWSSCVESSQVVPWADPPIRNHRVINFFSHTWFRCLVWTEYDSMLFPFPHRFLFTLYFWAWMAVCLRHLCKFNCEYLWQLFSTVNTRY